MTSTQLTDLLTHLDTGVRLVPHLDWLEPLLHNADTSARQTWPVFRLDTQTFYLVMLEQLLTTQDDDALHRWFELLHPSDLYLAHCCAMNTRMAIETFDGFFGKDINVLTARFSDAYHTREDLKQHLFEVLFVGESARIKEYSGQGFLLNWLRITTVRLFIDLQRSRRTPHREMVVDVQTLTDAMDHATSQNVELAYLKHTYRIEFRQAFEQATLKIPAHHKTLLRQHVIERRSIDQLGALYGIHRATAARRLEQARQQLIKETRLILMESLKIAPDQLDSILALINSQFDVSVERVLLDKDHDHT